MLMRKNEKEFLEAIRVKKELIKRHERARHKGAVVSLLVASLTLIVTIFPWQLLQRENPSLPSETDEVSNDNLSEDDILQKDTTQQDTSSPEDEKDELTLPPSVIALMSTVTSQKVENKTADQLFTENQMRLAIQLLQKSTEEFEGENVLISPLSVQLALAMAGNGASGETRIQMEKLVGGKLSLEELNQYLYTFTSRLQAKGDAKFEIANSIWFRDDKGLNIEQDFLQLNANYYGADAYRSPFDDSAVDAINQWVDVRTDGMIPKIIDEISPSTMLYLINALAFEAQWKDTYDERDVLEGEFSALGGTVQPVEYMYSEERSYLENEHVVGFKKSYKGGKYSFVALLPKENSEKALANWVSNLSVTELTEILGKPIEGRVKAKLPKFSCDFSWKVNSALENCGMINAFSQLSADFSKMGIYKNSNGEQESFYIGNVMHRTFITVAEQGTKAGAVTSIDVPGSAEPGHQEVYEVYLERPFLYMVVDDLTNLPVFIGVLTNVE